MVTLYDNGAKIFLILRLPSNALLAASVYSSVCSVFRLPAAANDCGDCNDKKKNCHSGNFVISARSTYFFPLGTCNAIALNIIIITDHYVIL